MLFEDVIILLNLLFYVLLICNRFMVFVLEVSSVWLLFYSMFYCYDYVMLLYSRFGIVLYLNICFDFSERVNISSARKHLVVYSCFCVSGWMVLVLGAPDAPDL